MVAPVQGATGIVVDAGGNAYVSRLDARRVVRVTPAGKVSTVVAR